MSFDGLRHEELTSRYEVLDAMQDFAAPGQQNLDSTTISGLRRYTDRLIEISGSEAEEELDRFTGVTERGLQLSHDRLYEQLQGKDVLVTGGTGCIGSALLRELKRYDPAKVISVSRGVTTPRQVVDGVSYQHADLRSPEATAAIISDSKPNIVYHLAAQHDPSLAEVEVSRTIDTNVFGTSNVINASEEAGVKQIIYASTGKAIRPFTPDTYASSKKIGEWMMANAAPNTTMSLSGVRFTHVVDNSIIFRRINDWADRDAPIRLHGPNIMFYMQSARESAHLLLDAGLTAQPGQFQLEAIRNLDWPVNLTDLALGSLIRRTSRAPLYIAGYEQGYEEVPYPGLYDPQYSGNLSPLINAWEAPEAFESPTCAQVDVLPFMVTPTHSIKKMTDNLRHIVRRNGSNDEIASAKDELSWEVLNSRLASIGRSILARSVKRMSLYPKYDFLPDEHIRTDTAVRKALARFTD